MHERLLLALFRAPTRLYKAAGLECDLIAENLKVGRRVVGCVGRVIVVRRHRVGVWSR